jgi:uncharacterized membrane protein YdcZ (DUF606 family)
VGFLYTFGAGALLAVDAAFAHRLPQSVASATVATVTMPFVALADGVRLHREVRKVSAS